jgi:hypothetical protein
MIQKHPICADRIRKIEGSFTFIEHRFLQDGFFASLNPHERSLYLFLILASDRCGLSYYSYDKICTLNGIIPDDYILARNSLIDKDLIAFDGSLFQVLSLPAKPCSDSPGPLISPKEMRKHDPATIRRLIEQSLGGRHD